MSQVLVAGASGKLGRAVGSLFRQRGHRVRALSRQRSLEGFDDLFTADALKPGALEGAASGCELVFSCLGASVLPELGRGYRSFTSVDTPANLALIAEAKRAGAKRFIYVSVCHVPPMKSLAYIRAHEDVVDALKASGLPFTIIRPTGFFSALGALVPLAAKGSLPLFGSGATKSNPIDDDDLAQVCVDAAVSGAAEVEAGGPESLTRAQMNALAFEAVGKPVKTMKAPLWLAELASPLLYPFNPRIAQFVEFIGALSKYDVEAPKRGTRTLADYFRSLKAASMSSRT